MVILRQNIFFPLWQIFDLISMETAKETGEFSQLTSIFMYFIGTL